MKHLRMRLDIQTKSRKPLTQHPKTSSQVLLTKLYLLLLNYRQTEWVGDTEL